MKLLIYYEQLGYGGVDTHLANLVNYWPHEKDSIIIASNRDNDGLGFLKQKIRRDNVSVKILNFNSSLKGTSFISKSFQFFWNRFFSFPIQFIRLARELKPDVILADNGGYPGGLTCFLAVIIAKIYNPTRKAALLIHHAPSPSSFLIHGLADLLSLFISLLRIPVVTVSQASKRSIEGNTPLKNIGVINNGIGNRQDISTKMNLRDRYHIDSQKVLLGMIGPIDSHKGHKVLIDSFARSPFLRQSAHIIIVGKGDPNLEEELRVFSKSVASSDMITFTGFLPDDSEAIVKQFDVLLMPTTEFEGFGYSLAEAMISGVPVVASRVGAIPDMVEDGRTGILVHPNDTNELAEALEKLVKGRSYRRQLGEQARKSIASQFSAEKMSQEYYSMLEER